MGQLIVNATWKAIIGVVLIFMLGCVFGGVSTAVIIRHRAITVLQGGPEVAARALERRTTRDLSLDAGQKMQIHVLLVTYIKQRIELQKQIRPQIRTLNADTLKQMNALLTPAQQAGLQNNLSLLKARYGRNPFNVGGEEAAATAIPPVAAGPAPATNVETK